MVGVSVPPSAHLRRLSAATPYTGLCQCAAVFSIVKVVRIKMEPLWSSPEKRKKERMEGRKKRKEGGEGGRGGGEEEEEKKKRKKKGGGGQREREGERRL